MAPRFSRRARKLPSLPKLYVGERRCPDCGGTGKTYWGFPALGRQCVRCEGAGKVRQT